MKGVAWAVVVVVTAGELPHRVKDELPVEFGREVPYGLVTKGEVAAANTNSSLLAAKAELGRRLFFDERLSMDGEVSCASCHLPEKGFADDRALSVGVKGRTTKRNAPSLFNRGLGKSFFWDGRAATLEEQVLMPIQDENEMGMTMDAVLERLGKDEEIVKGMGGKVTREGVSEALAGFVRTVWLGDSPVDRFQGGDFGALGVEERLGLWVYESKGACWRCHSGVNFSDEEFHNTGVGVVDGKAEEGRWKVTGKEEDRGKFKTPTLRGVALTGPYFHDGSRRTLEEVVAFYRGGGGKNAGLEEAVGGIEMTEEDGRNVVAFLKALSRKAEGKRVERGEKK